MAYSRHWYYFQANFLMKKITIISIYIIKNYTPHGFYLPTQEKITPPYTSQKGFGAKSLKWREGKGSVTYFE